MASIRQRSNGSFQVLFRRGGKQSSESFPDERGAAAFMRDIDRLGLDMAVELRDRASDDGDDEIPTVADWCRQYVHSRSGITIGTRRDYLTAIDNHIDSRKIGRLPVDRVDSEDIAEWLNAQERSGASGKSMRNRHGLLSASLAYAVRKKVRPDNPCEESRISKTAKSAMTFLSHGEFAVLLAAMPPRWQPLTITLAGTGLRFGEATALHVRNVHLDDGTPSLRVEQAWKWTDGSDDLLGPPKTEKGRRTVSLSPQVVEALRPLVDGKKAGDLVFTRAEGGRVRNVDYREGGWLRALNRAELSKRPRIHDLRHTHVAWLLSAGVPIAAVQARLGHESIRTTVDTYGHLLPETQRAAADATTVALSQALPELAGDGRSLPPA